MIEQLIKHKLFLIYLFILNVSVLGNSVPYTVLLNGKPEFEKTNSIQLVTETLEFNLQKQYYLVTVKYQFYNHKNNTNLNIAFPFAYSKDHVEANKNYRPADLTFISKNKKLKLQFSEPKDNTPNGGAAISYALSKVYFPSKKYTELQVQYKQNYNYALPPGTTDLNINVMQSEYIYGTAMYWYKNIKQFTIVIKNPYKFWIYNILSGFKIKKMPLLNNKQPIQVLLKNFKPKDTWEELSFTFTRKPIFNFISPVYSKYSIKYNYQSHIETLLDFSKTRKDILQFDYLSKEQLSLIKDFILYMNRKPIRKENESYLSQFKKYRKKKIQKMTFSEVKFFNLLNKKLLIRKDK